VGLHAWNLRTLEEVVWIVYMNTGMMVTTQMRMVRSNAKT
jgi:hypothetical protein